MICQNCGSSDFTWIGSKRVCSYCRSPYSPPKTERNSGTDTEVSICDDVKRLLKKCADDPIRARRYASLVLDIDPSNVEALRHL